MPDHHVKGQPAAPTYVREKGCLKSHSNRETPCMKNLMGGKLPLFWNSGYTWSHWTDYNAGIHYQKTCNCSATIFQISLHNLLGVNPNLTKARFYCSVVVYISNYFPACLASRYSPFTCRSTEVVMLTSAGPQQNVFGRKRESVDFGAIHQ